MRRTPLWPARRCARRDHRSERRLAKLDSLLRLADRNEKRRLRAKPERDVARLARERDREARLRVLEERATRREPHDERREHGVLGVEEAAPQNGRNGHAREEVLEERDEATRAALGARLPIANGTRMRKSGDDAKDRHEVRHEDGRRALLHDGEDLVAIADLNVRARFVGAQSLGGRFVTTRKRSAIRARACIRLALLGADANGLTA